MRAFHTQAAIPVAESKYQYSVYILSISCRVTYIVSTCTYTQDHPYLQLPLGPLTTWSICLHVRWFVNIADLLLCTVVMFDLLFNFLLCILILFLTLYFLKRKKTSLTTIINIFLTHVTLLLTFYSLNIFACQHNEKDHTFCLITSAFILLHIMYFLWNMPIVILP